MEYGALLGHSSNSLENALIYEIIQDVRNFKLPPVVKSCGGIFTIFANIPIGIIDILI